MILLLWFCLQDGISAEEFAERRTKLMAKVEDGVAILDTGPQTSVGSYDFAYLTNYHDDNGVAAFSPSDGKVYLFVKDPEAAKKASGLADVHPRADFEAWAPKFVKGKKVYTKLREKNLEIVSKHAASLERSTLARAIVRLRLIKSKTEQELTRKSSRISALAHVRAMKTIRAGMNERDAQRIYEEDFAKAGATPGYGYICGSGINGCTLHYSKNDERIPENSLIVCDCGTNYKGYVADVTRTFPTSGKFTKEQREKYQLVRDAQAAAEKLLKPGVTLRELHQAAAKVFEESGHTKWAFSHSKDRSVMHGLSHFVGLYVHDSGSYDTKLEPGMVITIEPGWYDKDQKWGIRIEDMYLVTEDGYEHLSKDAPREIEEIEKLMSEK
jgi:Xaa-Pro aminopeptidase